VRRYLEVVATRGVARLLVASVAARIPLGVNSLATILYLQARTGSFAVAGAAAGALALGIGVGGLLQSRVVDRLGPAFVVPAAGLHAAFLGLLIAAGALRWPAAVAIAAAGGAGVALPPISSLLRVQYGAYLGDRPQLLATAFAVDVMIVDTLWILGPLLVTLVFAIAGAAAALALSALSCVVGTGAFIALAAVAPAADRTPPNWRGALVSPGVATITLATLPLGFSFGVMEVALPAFARAEGHVGAAGPLVALLALSSVAGTVAFGSRTPRRSLLRVHLGLSALMPFFLAIVALVPTTLWSMLALIVLPGSLVGPIVASRNELTRLVAAPGTETEAFTWPVAAIFSGTAVGAAVAGAVIAAAGWREAMAVAAGVAAAGSFVIVARRATLTPVSDVHRGAAPSLEPLQ
jgi:hypothetical protein